MQIMIKDKSQGIGILLTTTFFLVIVLPVFLQATEKLNFNKPKHLTNKEDFTSKTEPFKRNRTGF